MSISFKGYGEKVLTFKTTLTEAGVPVIAGTDNKAYRASVEKDFIGITRYADGQYAGVIVDGYVEVPYTGSAPLYGFCNLVSNGANAVKTASSSTTSNHVVRVLKVDTENKIVGFIL